MSGHVQNMPENRVYSGCLSSYEIYECRRELRDILIAPFDESKCKGVGYNISPSELCYSVKRRCLLRVHKDAQEVYVMIPPNDTVLTLSHEYLQVGSRIAGCFLSRLRPMTKGLGNISTTLDPCWKGMLLLSINNPSSRKVKLVISQMAQDSWVPVGLMTMIIWRLPPREEEGNGGLTFRLDNPAMRTDIWSELTSEPNRLVGNKQYQQFRKLIDRLSNYTQSQNEPEWIPSLQEQLDNLECAIRSNVSNKDLVRKILFRIRSLDWRNMPQELQNKLEKLYGSPGGQLDTVEFQPQRIEETLAKLEHDDHKKEYLRDIFLTYQECNYQRLCFQMEQIHMIIQEESDYVRRCDNVKRLWHQFLRPHLSSILASLALALFLFLGGQAEEHDYITRIAISATPVLLSFLLDKKVNP